jgi:hypothetical protein
MRMQERLAPHDPDVVRTDFRIPRPMPKQEFVQRDNPFHEPSQMGTILALEVATV